MHVEGLRKNTAILCVVINILNNGHQFQMLSHTLLLTPKV